MDKYRKIRTPREKEPLAENEVRVSTKGGISHYITYALKLLEGFEGTEAGEDGEEKVEKIEKRDSVKVTAIGNCIPKCIVVAEILKRRVAGLHQLSLIGTTKITDTFEPKEEGLDPVEDVRMVSSLEVVLSRDNLDDKTGHYQAPVSNSELVDEAGLEDLIKSASAAFASRKSAGKGGKGRKGKGRGKGKGKGHRSSRRDEDGEDHYDDDDDEDDDDEDDRPKRGKGKGRKGKGKGKKGKGKKGKGKGKRRD